MTTPRSMSFAGCRTRAEMRQRLSAFLDDIADEHVRKVASDWLVQDGDVCDAEAFQQEVAQAREVFRRGHAEALQRFDEILDEEFGPERHA
jgi:hypothetical protein